MMMDDIETYEHEGVPVRIVYDEEPSSPREWDNVSILACWDRRMETEVEGLSPDRFEDEAAVARHLREEHGAVGPILPLFLLDHSGLSIRTGASVDDTRSADRFVGDGAGWDTSFVGFVFTNRERLDVCGTPEDMIEEALKQDIETYDDYLTGNVTAYIVGDEEQDEYESCWGFYGDLDHVKAEANSAAECIAEDRAKEAREVAEWAARDVPTVA